MQHWASLMYVVNLEMDGAASVGEYSRYLVLTTGLKT